MIKLEYKGVDITGKVSINTCYHDMYAENKADGLYLRVNDVNHIWDTWQPKPNDEIKVTYGAISTGKMYVVQCTPVNGLYVIKATAAPPGYKKKNSKAWQQVKLLQIAQEIAGRHGLEFKQYGVTNQQYQYILQANMDDFTFLSRLCRLESCALIIYDGTLTMYSQQYMENQGTNEQIELSTDADYEFYDRSATLYGSCEIEGGIYDGSFKVNNGADTVLRATSFVNIGSSAEASRYAMGLLRDANKNAMTGYIRGDISLGYAAGSCANIKNPRASSWDGDVFLYHVRNDYANNESKLFFRKSLEGY